jgi:hypothetical protein
MTKARPAIGPGKAAAVLAFATAYLFTLACTMGAF